MCRGIDASIDASKWLYVYCLPSMVYDFDMCTRPFWISCVWYICDYVCIMCTKPRVEASRRRCQYRCIEIKFMYIACAYIVYDFDMRPCIYRISCVWYICDYVYIMCMKPRVEASRRRCQYRYIAIEFMYIACAYIVYDFDICMGLCVSNLICMWLSMHHVYETTHRGVDALILWYRCIEIDVVHTVYMTSVYLCKPICIECHVYVNICIYAAYMCLTTPMRLC